MKLILSFVLVAFFAAAASAQPCVDAAKQVKPVLSEETKEGFNARLGNERTEFGINPDNLTNIIWLGRFTAYLGEYKAAIKIYADGLKWHPKSPEIFRHRGHRYITLRCFDDAIRDFETAAKLIKGKPDVTELDGLPNARNIPTSTLQSNIWYHLGLAYYLKGDFKEAERAYAEALKVSKNDDMLVATTHWYYMTLRRLGKKAQAQNLLRPFNRAFEVIENEDYLKLIRLYRGDTSAGDFHKNFANEANTLSNSSLGYGWGNWNLYNGEPEDAKRIFGFVVEGNQWASFGFIASKVEMKEFG